MIEDLTTETRNPRSFNLDTMTAAQLVAVINQEDQLVAQAVATQQAAMAQAIDAASARYANGGRLFYCGAGTSGRLGVLDAVELVPTYGIKPERAIGLIAGGPSAMYAAVEGAEDDADLGKKDLLAHALTAQDIVIGIAASGRTPYVIGALDQAHATGALTISVACVQASAIGEHADIAIEAVVGPEVVTGSTRMKAGTAQKMILNTLSTGIMIKQGKVYQNLMVDVLPTNQKLVDRALRIIATTAEVSRPEAEQAFAQANQQVPLAIVIAATGLNAAAATQALANHGGRIRETIADAHD